MNTTTKPCFYYICAIYEFNRQKLQEIATVSGISKSTVEAMCRGTAVARSDAKMRPGGFLTIHVREGA